MFFGSQVLDLHRAILKDIPVQHDSLSLPADTDTYILVFARRIFKPCIVNGDIPDFPLNIDADPLLFCAIIANNTILDLVPAAASKFIRLITKQYPDLAVALDCALPDNIVCVTVPDTDSVSAVIRQHTILCQPIRNAPAEENPLTVAPGKTLLEDGPLGAAPGMESQVAVVYRFAV